MNADSSIIPYLFLVTFVLALGFGMWQIRRARKARNEAHQSADARVHGDQKRDPPSERGEAK